LQVKSRNKLLIDRICFVYFLLRIMQFPVQAWLRITLNHGSITQLTILSDGSVILKTVGDSGFIPSTKITF